MTNSEKLNCRYCSKQAVQYCSNPAIPNIHSNWITNSIVAMQRPHKKSHFEHSETPLIPFYLFRPVFKNFRESKK